MLSSGHGQTRPPDEGQESSRAVNEQVPAFSDSVEITWREGRGRYGVARRDLLPGTLLLEEPALASRISPELSAEYCDQCLARAALRPVPCRLCRDKAGDSHHRWECSQGETLSQVWSEVNQEVCGGQTRLRITQVQLCYR